MEGMNKNALINAAASLLGEANVSGGTPTPLGEALEDNVKQAVRLALDYTHWDFALERAVCRVVDGCTEELPEDCLEVREVEGVSNWRRAGNRIYADGVQELAVWYKSSKLAETLNLPDNEPFFCEGCVLMLAAKAAPRVTGNFNLGSQLEKKAYESLYRAKLKEARSADSNDQKPNTENIWEHI
jgi:hypothetical protein